MMLTLLTGNLVLDLFRMRRDRQIPGNNLIEKDPVSRMAGMLKRRREPQFQELLCFMMIAVLKNIFHEAEIYFANHLRNNKITVI